MEAAVGFLVFPDTPAGAAAADAFGGAAGTDGPYAREVVEHASGRPWIVRGPAAEPLLHAAAGRNRAVLIGPASASRNELEKALAAARSVRDLDALCARLAGAFHLIASIGGDVRVQGSISTARQVFHARLGGVTVASDVPAALVERMDGASLDEELIAGRLVAPWAPWPLNERPLWTGLDAVPAGCYLRLDAAGAGRPVRWWTPPAPDVPLEEGARRVRDALRDAVAVRARGAGTISADLSGGMDSTSLCFLADGEAERLVTTRWEAADPADEDRVWAGRAAAYLPDAEHLVLSRDTAPTWFDGIAEDGPGGPDIEGPFAWIRTRARLLHMAGRVAAAGSAAHLTGHGGDELFLGNPLNLHTLLRTRRAGAVRYLRAYRAMYRWRLAPTVRALLSGESFGQWLAASAETLTDPLRETGGAPAFGWGIGYRLPPWATADAVASARRLFRRAGASGVEPLAPVRGQHAALQDARLCGDTLRRVDRLTSGAGVRWHAPFVDDRVVEAALAVRFEDVTMPDRYKPALTAAMRGIVPEPVLGRSTKSEYSAEAYHSLRRHRAELLGLCGDDMRLARLGLVDAAALRSTLEALPPSSFTLMPLISTFACETWLRAAGAPRPGPRPRPVPAG
ncbi:asparagine synthase-related protein [Actinomadura yumaensis]|uniref:asparagine synthase (glutamine-hydrolyzing) n=1 Tax=Actinomadura yumaensis TaxID=111807 RepID=A0ABW2CYV7_9ACTN|nr:asparagine synthase [Actinomadura sp. J1-007]